MKLLLYMRNLSIIILIFNAVIPVISGDKITEEIEQKDWPEYFPEIEVIPSQYEPEFQQVDMSYETPHTKWAKPYLGGTIKALVIAPRVCQRDTIELAQRLDMDFKVFSAYGWTRLGGDKFDPFSKDNPPNGQMGRYSTPVGYEQESQQQRLQQLLQGTYDVIILGKMVWTTFPENIKSEILRQVKSGCGLLIAYTGGQTGTYVPKEIMALPEIKDFQTDWISAGIPFAALCATEKCPPVMISARRYGKGRVVVISGKNSSNSFVAPEFPTAFENRLWELDYYFGLAAKAVIWAAKRTPESSITLQKEERRIILKSAGFGKAFTVNFKIRNEYGETVFTKTGSDLTFALPELPAGNYVADAVIGSDGKYSNWTSLFFEVKKDCEIKMLAFSGKTAKPDETMEIKITLSSKAETGMKIQLLFHDPLQRLIKHIVQDIKPGVSEHKVKFSLEKPLFNLARMKAVLLKEQQVQSVKNACLPVKLEHPQDDFGFVCWDTSSREYVWHYARKELYKLGVDASYGGRSGLECLTNAGAGIYTIPYMTRYALSKITAGNCPVRIPCLNDPAYIAAEQKKLKKITEATSPFAPAGYSLGDENDLSVNKVEVCFSKHCRDGFRNYVKRSYFDLDALNKEWQTSFKSWDEVEAAPLAKAQKLNQPARWVDFRTFMEEVFLKIHEIGSQTVKSIDSNALVGFDGGFDISSFNGYDWWRLSQLLDLWGIYPDHLQAEILRSFHKKNARTGRWYGGYNHRTRFVAYAEWEPWYDLFHEMNNIWWFSIISPCYSTVTAENTMNPASFRPFPILKASSDETLKIKNGIGKLLLGVRRDHGGVALLYSQASLHASTFYGNCSDPNAGSYDFIRILEDLNYQYRFISYEQLSDGILDKEKYRCLILPGTIALSDGEKQQIMEFAKRGGVVIADIEAGLYNDHGNVSEDKRWKDFIKDKIIGNAVKAYKKDRPGATGKRLYFSKLLKAQGIEPEFDVIAADGNCYEGELAVFTDGKVRYVGLLRDHSPQIKSQDAIVKFPSKYQVYDVKGGKYLGHVDNVAVKLPAGNSALWALFPEKVLPPELVVKPEAAPGETIQVKINLPSPYRRVIHLSITDPAGRELRHYGRNLNVVAGMAETVIPLALNDVAGCWTISATDVASGLKTTKILEVKQR
ncbi:MAG: beta-galactosidase [Victivallaceae bacterium]|nr:beta-galactosidase [Victivallaceae bacterium]